MTYSIAFDCNGERAAQAAQQALDRRGFRVQRSFDLRSAWGAHSDCACPHHGPAVCACQFVVLLVYPAAGGPLVVTTHSQDQRAQACLADDPGIPVETGLAQAIMAALFEAALQVQAANALV